MTSPGDPPRPLSADELRKALDDLDPATPGRYADGSEVAAEVRQLKGIIKALYAP